MKISISGIMEEQTLPGEDPCLPTIGSATFGSVLGNGMKNVDNTTTMPLRCNK